MSRMAFLDLNLHVLQVATLNSNYGGRSVVQNCTSDTPYEYIAMIRNNLCIIQISLKYGSVKGSTR